MRRMLEVADKIIGKISFNRLAIFITSIYDFNSKVSDRVLKRHEHLRDYYI